MQTVHDITRDIISSVAKFFPMEFKYEAMIGDFNITLSKHDHVIHGYSRIDVIVAHSSEGLVNLLELDKEHLDKLKSLIYEQVERDRSEYVEERERLLAESKRLDRERIRLRIADKNRKLGEIYKSVDRLKPERIDCTDESERPCMHAPTYSAMTRDE